jgi:hypothetical protein
MKNLSYTHVLSTCWSNTGIKVQTNPSVIFLKGFIFWPYVCMYVCLYVSEGERPWNLSSFPFVPTFWSSRKVHSKFTIEWSSLCLDSLEYSSLRDFYKPLGNNNNNNEPIFYRRIFERWFWLVLKLEISYYRVIISWKILVSFRGFFEDYIFAWWNICVSLTLLLH